MSNADIPLKSLICDNDRSTAVPLRDALKDNQFVLSCSVVEGIEDAQRLLKTVDFNTIFIDPLSLGDAASEFIFSTRKKLPEIVFVLYVDLADTEANRHDFYKGQRHRFSHYYRLDKRTPGDQLTDELATVVRTCQHDLEWRMSTVSLQRLRDEARESAKAGLMPSSDSDLLNRLSDAVDRMPQERHSLHTENTVFLSYRFEETEYADGLTRLLVDRGLKIVTGKRANNYISKVIIDRIRTSAYFVCLMTRADRKENGKYTTSAWLVEEKGVALALGKPVVLMVEKGVEDIGGLEGDWQRILFTPKEFLTAALDAADQLATYAGK